MAWKKKEKRIVSSAVEVVPTKSISTKSKSIELSEEEKVAIHKEKGLTYGLHVETVVQGLKAMVAILDSEGKIVNSVPANTERAKFLQASENLLRINNSDRRTQPCPQINIYADGRLLTPKRITA